MKITVSSTIMYAFQPNKLGHREICLSLFGWKVNILYKQPIAMQIWLIISCKLIMKPNFNFLSLGSEVKLEQTLWQAWESFNLLGSLGDADGGGDLDKAARFQLKQQIQNYKQESSILISCNWTFSFPLFFMFSLCRNVVMVVNIEDQIRKTAHHCTG